MLKPQFKLGAFLVVVLAAMGIVIIMLGQVSLKKGYEINVLFDNIGDLPEGSTVKMYGVKVGRVESVELYKNQARVVVWLRDDVRIGNDARAEISQMGFIGSTILTLTRGSEGAPRLKQGDTIVGHPPLSYSEIVDKLMEGLTEVTKAFEGLENIGVAGQNIGNTFKNLSEMTEALNKSLGKEGQKLAEAIDNLNRLLKTMDRVVDEELTGTAESIKKLAEASDELTIILRKIKAGEGTAGKLISSDEYSQKIRGVLDSIYEASRDMEDAVKRFKGFDTTYNSDVYYSPEDDLMRSYAGLTLVTSSDRFLNLALENIAPSEGSYKDYDMGGDRFNSLTVKAGKNIGNFTVFAGAIRSSGGLGALWNPLPMLKLGTEWFEFSRLENPRGNISTSLKLMDFLKMGVSYEDLLEDGDFRAGLGVEIK
ncbi:MAG: MlaD family protein [Elusimicrobiota bacterium]|nr:MlaD family protein [Elusimicrobiota bacterium]